MLAVKFKRGYHERVRIFRAAHFRKNFGLGNFDVIQEFVAVEALLSSGMQGFGKKNLEAV